MSLHPIRSELIHDPEFDALIENIGKYPQMYINPPTLATLIAYVEGFNHGRNGSPLLGLKEWLVVRAGDGNNLHWSGLACREIAGDRNASLTRGEDQGLLAALTRLIQEFLAYRQANGLSKLFWEYAEWLRRQEWYSGPLPPDPGAQYE